MHKVVPGQLELFVDITAPEPCPDHLHRFITADGYVWKECIYCHTAYNSAIHSGNSPCLITTKDDLQRHA